MPAIRFVHLIRHAEPAPDGSGLSARGREQAAFLGERLARLPLASLHHGPLPRAAETAGIIGERVGVRPQLAETAGDYVPYVPRRDELPSHLADFYLGFLADTSPEEARTGAELACQAVDLYTGPAEGDTVRHDVVVTHNFLVAWLVREALHAPAWRWLGINHSHASLTTIRHTPGRAPYLHVQNDLSHLPPELRWTDRPEERV
ncbi:histidine phosphatase family protein [Streptomyces sp. NPDC088923]|uniref:histidine phosphatase family protein n=1 Tax=Streptomyces sp. NPDC088923 TaxID=3365913 RepID=UPI003819DA6C